MQQTEASLNTVKTAHDSCKTLSTCHEHSFYQFECHNRSEIDIGRALLRFAASPTPTLEAFLDLSDPYTNYFYESSCNTYGVGLIVPDRPELREEAARLDICHLVYFGYNGDPVTICSLHDVYTKLTTKLTRKDDKESHED